MERRDVLCGGAAAIAAAAMSTVEAAVNPPPGLEWESVQLVREPYPHGVRFWPEHRQRYARMAVDRLLIEHPGARVVSEASECMGPGHPRYPDPDPERPQNDGAYYLVHRIRLDRPVPVETT